MPRDRGRRLHSKDHRGHDLPWLAGHVHGTNAQQGGQGAAQAWPELDRPAGTGHQRLSKSVSGKEEPRKGLKQRNNESDLFQKELKPEEMTHGGGTLNRPISSATKKEQMTGVNNSLCDKLLLLSLSRLVQKIHNHSTAGSKTWRNNPKWKMT